MNCRTHLQFATKLKTTVYEAAHPSQLCQNIAMPTHILPYVILEKCCCGWVYAIAYILLSLMYSCHWSWDGKPKEVHWILAQGYVDGGKKGQWRGQQWESTVTEQDSVVAEEQSLADFEWKYNWYIQYIFIVQYACHIRTCAPHITTVLYNYIIIQLYVLCYYCKKWYKICHEESCRACAKQEWMSHLVSQWMAVSASTQGTMLKKCATTSVRCSVCREKDRRAR